MGDSRCGKKAIIKRVGKLPACCFDSCASSSSTALACSLARPLNSYLLPNGFKTKINDDCRGMEVCEEEEEEDDDLDLAKFCVYQLVEVASNHGGFNDKNKNKSSCEKDGGKNDDVEDDEDDEDGHEDDDGDDNGNDDDDDEYDSGDEKKDDDNKIYSDVFTWIAQLPNGGLTKNKNNKMHFLFSKKKFENSLMIFQFIHFN